VTVTAVVPIKSWRRAKSRLDLPAEGRAALARGFALDVVEALRTAASVGVIVLVTKEPDLATAVGGSEALAVVDDSFTPSPDGLNHAVRLGRGWASSYRDSDGLLIIPADLPAITGGAVDDAVRDMLPFDRAFVPDIAGDGTTLLFSRTPAAMRSHYGAQSASRHRTSGFHPVTTVDPVVRRDVDTLADLIEARHLGVGAHTRSVLERLGCPGRRPSVSA
jgi:2-phospho-L-lactate guanylyltransferase